MKRKIIRRGNRWRMKRKLDADELLLLVITVFIVLVVFLQLFMEV